MSTCREGAVERLEWSAVCKEARGSCREADLAADLFHLGWFLGNSFGVHGWNQPWGGTSGEDWSHPDLHVDLAKAAERACFDFVLLEDSVFVPDNYGSSMDFYLKRALRAPKNDPLPLVPLMAQATSRLGLVPTISTSFYPPVPAGAADRDARPDVRRAGWVATS